MPVIYQSDLVLATFHCSHLDTNRVSMVTMAFDDKAINLGAPGWAEGLHVAWGDSMQGTLTSEAAWTKCTVLKGDGTSVPEVGESVTGPYQGGFAMSACPPNVAILVKKVTGFGGRANRGRFYLPWSLSEGAVNEVGIINPADVAATEANLIAFEAATSTLQQVIANRVYDLPWDNPARQLIAVNIGKEVNSLVVDNLCATQRRRLR